MESCVAYVTSHKSIEVSDDLGYRWSSGEMTDWEVLSELTGVRVPILKNILGEMTYEEWDAHDSWRRAGWEFDSLLGPQLYEGIPPFKAATGVPHFSEVALNI